MFTVESTKQPSDLLGSLFHPTAVSAEPHPFGVIFTINLTSARGRYYIPHAIEAADIIIATLAKKATVGQVEVRPSTSSNTLVITALLQDASIPLDDAAFAAAFTSDAAGIIDDLASKKGA